MSEEEKPVVSASDETDDRSAAGMDTEMVAALRGVGKTFGATVALDDVDLEIRDGTIHALVGENGAGKSTALGILAGRISATVGSVELFGEETRPGNPRAARESGLAAIYQELTIVPDLDAAANVFIGQPMARGGILSKRRMQRAYEGLCAQIGVPSRPAGVVARTMSVAEQQVLEILRALAVDARVILFDEPTASLGISERQALMGLLKKLRADGKTMVFVTHNLDEVMEIADTITVFRNGRRVASAPRSEWTKAKVVDTMIGEGASHDLVESLRDELLDTVEAPSSSREKHLGRPVLEVADLTVPGVIEGISIQVREGEILGLGGLVGSGRTSILRALAGLTPRARGRLLIDGAEKKLPHSVRAARHLGLALLPEDRKGQGLALEMSGAVNVLMADPRAATSFGFIRRRRARELAGDAAQEFGFDRARIDELAGRFSGGNQQKILLARWAHSSPRVLLVDEPTRGIDIGAKEEVMRALERMASEGMAIVFVSSELEEVALISDRVVVIAEGKQVAELESGDSPIRASDILKTAFAVEGVQGASSSAA
jgi:ABC-type sugar transport system ATPase subunit